MVGETEVGEVAEDQTFEWVREVAMARGRLPTEEEEARHRREVRRRESSRHTSPWCATSSQ